MKNASEVADFSLAGARTEQELQLRDYLVTYGQARAAGVDTAEALHMATVTRHGMALVRAHDAAVLDLKQ